MAETRNVTVRLSRDEFDKLSIAARAAGLTSTAMAHALIVGRRPRVDHQLAAVGEVLAAAYCLLELAQTEGSADLALAAERHARQAILICREPTT